MKFPVRRLNSSNLPVKEHLLEHRTALQSNIITGYRKAYHFNCARKKYAALLGITVKADYIGLVKNGEMCPSLREWKENRLLFVPTNSLFWLSTVSDTFDKCKDAPCRYYLFSSNHGSHNTCSDLRKWWLNTWWSCISSCWEDDTKLCQWEDWNRKKSRYCVRHQLWWLV